jgi:hypothetical protein
LSLFRLQAAGFRLQAAGKASLQELLLKPVARSLQPLLLKPVA